MTRLHFFAANTTTFSFGRAAVGRIWLILALAALVGLASLQNARSRAAQAQLAQGDAQRADYLYLSALESYRQAAALDSTAAEPLLRMGEMYLALGQYVEALQAFAQASQRSGTTPAVHAGLARALAAWGDLDSAAHHWRQAITQQPSNVQFRLELARILMAQSKWDEAQVALSNSLPASAETHFVLGQLLALDNPQPARAHLLAAAQDGNYTATVAEWLEALHAADDAAYRAARVGRLALMGGDLHLARRAFARAIELEPAYGEAYAYLGYTLDQLGSDGGPLLARAVELAPDSVVARHVLGAHLRQQGDVSGAQAMLDAALARDPTNPALMVEIGMAALQNGEYVACETWLIRAAEVEPANPAWVKVLAHFYLDHLIEVQDKGLPTAQQAVRLAPVDAEARDLLGWALYLTGHPISAQAELQRAMELNPRLASARYHMAAVLAALGQPARARLELERAISLDPAGAIGRRAREMLNP